MNPEILLKKRIQYAQVVVQRLVKLNGGNKDCQNTAAFVTKRLIEDGDSAFTAMDEGFKAAMKIKDNTSIKAATA